MSRIVVQNSLLNLATLQCQRWRVNVRHCNHTCQRRGVDRIGCDHPVIACQRNLQPPDPRRPHRDVIVGSQAYRRSTRLLAWYPLDHNQHEPAGSDNALRLAKQPSVLEHLVGVEVVALGHHRH